MLSLGSAPDLLRLLAVPVFGWAAWRDIRTRRVPNRTWLPLIGLGILALVVEGWLVLTGQLPVFRRAYAFRVVFSVGFLVPLSYGFWWIGGFGGADAKALITLAVLFPTFPTYFVGDVALPLVVTTLGVFSLTILSNTVVAGVFYPVVLLLRNAVAGRFSPVMFVGRPVAWQDAVTEYGRLLQTPDGFTRRGLDLDALRMYLQWRDTTLAAVREDPEHHRDPASLPAEPSDPGDGSLSVDEDAGQLVSDGGDSVAKAASADAAADVADPWGAEQFLDDIEGSAYGTSPEQLRGGLETLTTEDEVWITPGVPFLVPMFVGLLVGLVYGDLLFAALQAIGFA